MTNLYSNWEYGLVHETKFFVNWFELESALIKISKNDHNFSKNSKNSKTVKKKNPQVFQKLQGRWSPCKRLPQWVFNTLLFKESCNSIGWEHGAYQNEKTFITLPFCLTRCITPKRINKLLNNPHQGKTAAAIRYNSL